MTRSEHLQWAKDRALEQETSLMMMTSFFSDMGKHDELKYHMGLALIMTVELNSTKSVRNFIEGFN